MSIIVLNAISICTKHGMIIPWNKDEVLEMLKTPEKVSWVLDKEANVICHKLNTI